MSRIGYRCDGDDCTTSSTHTGPPAVVRDADGNWLELCNGCYDDWEADDGN